MENFSEWENSLCCIHDQAGWNSLQSRISPFCYEFNLYIRIRVPAGLAGNSMDIRFLSSSAFTMATTCCFLPVQIQVHFGGWIFSENSMTLFASEVVMPLHKDVIVALAWRISWKSMEIQEPFASQSPLSLGGEEISVLDMMSGSSQATVDKRS